MNKADSERLAGDYHSRGYKKAKSINQADEIIINTCSVRQRAEDRVDGLILNLMSQLQARKPKPKIILTGCMIHHGQNTLLDMFPFVDEILPINEVGFNQEAIRRDKHHAWIPISNGCNSFCSYCIVPFSRGREKSRPMKEILTEIKKLVDQGYSEITLVGQNVNSYGKRGLKNPMPFHELLYGIAEIPGVERLRFTTSHPNDFTRETIRAYRDLDILMNHLHLPVQSGNNQVLKAMRRDHTIEEYRDLLAELKTEVPDISLSTDIIVGFPGETDAAFADTLKIMKEVGYSSSYMFAYSPRPGTPANELPDSVPEETKKHRLQEVIALQHKQSEQLGQTFVGENVEVLIEGRSSKPGYAFKGRNPQYWNVNIQGGDEIFEAGDMVTVQVEEVTGHSLNGRATRCETVIQQS